MGARGRVWMRVCAGFESGECRGKTPCRCVFGGLKTLKDFVIFGGFEDQRVWESSSALRRASVYAALRLWKIRFDNKMITVEILILF
jgi:hypothetical protein